MGPKPNLWTLDEVEEKERKRYAAFKDQLEGFDFEIKNKKRREDTLKFWEDREVELLITLLGIRSGMRFVNDNIEELREMMVYERALMYAYAGVRSNLHHWDHKEVKYMFEIADPEKMRAAGDKMPNRETFTLYRGVAGNGPARRKNSVSWTESINVAAFFAMRFNHPDPAVFRIVVPNEAVLTFYNGRSESEYLLKLPLPVNPKRIPDDQMERAYQAYLKDRNSQNGNSVGFQISQYQEEEAK